HLSWRTKAALVLSSLIVSLGLAELAASALDRGAFPFLNLFVADMRYGVLLRPSASTRVRSRGGRVTEIRTHALGFRGPEWSPAPGAARVLLVGDSQALGYNIPWEASIAARLERALGGGARVLAAAVPSWGPTEYALAVQDLKELRPTHV